MMNEWALIFAMTAITFGIRYILLATAGRWQLPVLLEQSLKYVPVAVLSVIVVQTLMVEDRASEYGWGLNPGFVLAGVVAFVVARLTSSLMFSVILGLLVYWLYQF